MTAKYKHIFAHGDKIVTYRQKKNGVFEARFYRQGIDIEVSSKDLQTLKQKFIDALNNYAATGSVKAKTGIPYSSTTLQKTGYPSKKKRQSLSLSKNTSGCSSTIFSQLSPARRSPK